MYRKTTLAAFSAALALWAGVVVAAAPATITHGGFLQTSTGAPVSAPTDLTFRFYSAASGGVLLASEIITVAPGTDGFFTAIVGSGIPNFHLLFDAQVYMSIQVQGDAAEMTPRIPITSVPSALSVDWSGISNRPGVSSCSGSTPFVTGVDANGVFTCAAMPPGSAGCASGQILKYNGSAWACAADNDTSSGGTVTSVGATASGGLQTAGTAAAPTLGLVTTCAANQILKWTGSAWACAADVDTNSGGTVTSVVAGTGLTGGTITGTGTIAANFFSSGGDGGAATTVARGDHVHDARYYTQSQLNATGGTINGGSNPVDWSRLKNIPANIASYGGPRFANGWSGATTPLGVGAANCTAYASVSITVPGPGTIAVEATTQMFFNHTSGTKDEAWVFIGSTASECADPYGLASFSNSPTDPTGFTNFTANPRRPFTITTAGTYTYYVTGYMNSGTAYFNWGRIFATYYPN